MPSTAIPILRSTRPRHSTVLSSIRDDKVIGRLSDQDKLKAVPVDPTRRASRLASFAIACRVRSVSAPRARGALVSLALASAAPLAVPVVGLASTASPPAVTGALIWAAPVRIDAVSIVAVACPSADLCVAVDDAGHVLSSGDPSGGAGKWRRNDVDGRTALTAVSCPSRSLCVAADAAGDVVTSTDPGSLRPAWKVTHVDSSLAEPSPYGGGPDLLQGVSCPTVSLCVAVDSVGNVIYSRDPTGGASAWALAHADGNSDPDCTGIALTCQAALIGVACPTASLCAAVDFAGNILQTMAPASSLPWTSRPASAAPTSLWGLSCPTATLCATVDGDGGSVISWNPARGSVPTSTRLPAPAFGIWCRSQTLCLASAEGTNGTSQLLASANPVAISPHWTVTDFGAFTGVSCPLASSCLGTDDQGEIVAGATVSSLATALDREALGGHLPSIGELLRQRGRSLRFTSPLAGQLQLDWETSAHATTRGSSPTILASATIRFAAPRTSRVVLTLTPAGRSMLMGARRLTLTAAATFTANNGTVATHRQLTLSARR